MSARQKTGRIGDQCQLALHHCVSGLSERRRGIIARVLLRQIEHCPHRLADLATHDHDHTLSLQRVANDLSFVTPVPVH